MNIAGLPLIILIRGYQYLISPILPQSCRYHPSCSEYGVAAIRRFGAVAGGYLTARRLLRCQPWGGCGDDPVPETLDGIWPWSLRRAQPGHSH